MDAENTQNQKNPGDQEKSGPKSSSFHCRESHQSNEKTGDFQVESLITPPGSSDFQAFIDQALYPLLALLVENALKENEIFELEIPSAYDRVLILHSSNREGHQTQTISFDSLGIPKDSYPDAALRILSTLRDESAKKRFGDIWRERHPKTELERLISPVLIHVDPSTMENPGFLRNLIQAPRLEGTLRISRADKLSERYLPKVSWSGKESSSLRINSLSQFRHFELLVQELLLVSRSEGLLAQAPQFSYGTRSCRLVFEKQSHGSFPLSVDLQRLALAWGILDSSEFPPEAHSEAHGGKRRRAPEFEETQRPRSLTLRMPRKNKKN
jgi:hypothetical protein